MKIKEKQAKQTSEIRYRLNDEACDIDSLSKKRKKDDPSKESSTTMNYLMKQELDEQRAIRIAINF
jgi:hypothetical protein